MVTLIVETSLDGSRRRCDANCYNAKRPKCRCICQGKNHGVGLEKALDQMVTVAYPALKLLPDEIRNLPLFKQGGQK